MPRLAPVGRPCIAFFPSLVLNIYEMPRCTKEYLLRLLKALFLAVSLLLAACAANQATSGPPAGYVEIDNPALTMSPDAPAKIWVPKSYVESGIPRGGELVKKGAEKVVQSFKAPAKGEPTAAAQQLTAAPAAPPAPLPMERQTTVVAGAPPISPAIQQPVAVAPQPYAGRDAAAAAVAPKTRFAILELGQNGLARLLYDNLRRAALGGLLDPGQTAFLAQYSTITNDQEKASFAVRLQQEYGANAVIFLSAPDGVEPGKTIYAEVYDAMAGGLLRKFDTTLPFSLGTEQAERNAAIAAAMTGFTEKLKELAALLPWYGRITVVEGNRVYIAAGKEAGLCTGLVMKVYHNGKFVKGLGYAPGERIGTLVVEGFVGPNGSFGTIKEGQGIQTGDVVSIE